MRKIFTFFLALIVYVGTIFATEGALKGTFTINASGDLIQFSQGNLQATTTDLGASWTWSFATNQWDYIGNEVANNAISGNGTVSSNGTVDLFSWSTAATYYGINNSTDNDDYSGDFVDWGNNPIANGGNKANAWRTLEMEEWAYLFFGRTDAAQLFSLGKVNGVNGTILLPDNWSGDRYDNAADGLTDQGTYYENASGTNFTFHTYDSDAWNAMAEAGAVFLPAEGYRNGTGVNSAGLDGYFWTATSYDHRPYYLGFGSTYLDPQSYGPRHLGHAVRLVHDVPAVGDEFYATPYLNSDETILHFRITSLSPNSEVEIMAEGHTIPENANLFITNVKYLGNTFSIKSVASGAKFQNADTIVLSPDVVTFPVETMNLPNLKEFGLLTGSSTFAVVDKVLYTKDKTKLLRCPAKHAFTTFPNTVTELETYAFRGCSELGEIVLPSGMTKVSQGAFYQSSVTKITVPASVEDLDDSCFGSCTSLAEIVFEDASSIKKSSWNSFSNCKVVNDQSADGWVIVDGLATHFRGAWPETVVVPEGVVNMATAVFYPYASGFGNVKKIVLPTTLKRLDESAFAEQTPRDKMVNLEKVIVRAPAFVNIGDETQNLRLWSDKPIKLVVPCGLESEYAAATIWKSAFSTVEEGMIWNVQLNQTSGGTILAEETSTCGEVKMTAVPAEGYVFSQWNDGVKTNPRTITVTEDMSISASFAYIVNNVALTVTFPEKGAAIESNGHAYTPAELGLTNICPEGAKYNVPSVYFFNGQGNYFDEKALKPGTKYTMQFFVAANEGATFPYDGEYVDIRHITTTVNGNNREDYSWSKEYCIFAVTFTTEKELINAISVDVTFPDKGDAIEACSGYTDPSAVATVTCPDGAHYACNRVVFYKEGECFSETTLLPSTTYQMALEFVADDGYYFPSAIEDDGVERVQNDQISFTINSHAETCGEHTVGVARCYVEFTTSKQTYTVRFLDWDDTVLDTQSVVEGEDAIAPENPTRAGWIFTGWDKPFTNIQADTDVKALYEQDTTGFDQIDQSSLGNDKFIRDGKLFIRRGDEIFNAQGVRVK